MHWITTLLLSFAPFAQDNQDEQAKRIDDLIKQLGSDEFSAREKASGELKKIGKPAEEPLRRAAGKSDDPEVRDRARALLEAMIPRPKAQAPGLRGFNGSSVTVRSINGDSTYTIAPGDGSPAIAFHKDKAGAVKLDYTDEKGESTSVAADSLEKFVKDNKDLAGKFGITEEGIDHGGARVSFKGGLQAVPFPRAFRAPKPPLDEDDDRGAGATFAKPSEPLRAQLDIPDGQGLVVTSVDKDGAAETAGLRKNDVLLEIDGNKVTSIRAVRDHFTRTSSLELLRKGKRESLTPRKDF
jgi:hypothetical protein